MPHRLLAATCLLALLAGCSQQKPPREPRVKVRAVARLDGGGEVKTEGPPQPGADEKTATPALPKDDKPGPADTPTADAKRIQHLVNAGWTREAATRVVGLNARWWDSLDDDKEVEKQLEALADLGHVAGLCDLLARRPEAAGLFVCCEQKRALKDLLAGEDYPVLAGLFARHAAPAEADELIRALGRHRKLILALQASHLPGSEAVFLCRAGSEPIPAYEKWLEDQVGSRLKGPTEQLASFIHFLLDSGDALRARMKGDLKFQDAFPALWEKLARVASSDGRCLEQFFDEPCLWELLALPEGEKLLKVWGPSAAGLLVGAEAYPEDLRPQVTRDLLDGNVEMAEAYLTMRKRDKEDKVGGRFHSLLRRPLGAETRQAAIQKLLEAQSNYPEELAKMADLSDEALGKHVGPPREGLVTYIPGYNAFEALEKWSEGREVSSLEWMLAIADVLPAGTALAGSAVKQTGKEAVKQAGKALIREGVKAGVRRATRATAAQVARQTLYAGATRMLADIPKKLAGAWKALDRAASIDITAPVRFFYQRSAAARGLFRSWGIEPRLLMRANGTVRFHLLRKDNVNALIKTREKVVKFFEATQAPDPLPKVVTLARETVAEFQQKDEESWQRNIAAWWLMNACRLTDRLGKD